MTDRLRISKALTGMIETLLRQNLILSKTNDVFTKKLSVNIDVFQLIICYQLIKIMQHHMASNTFLTKK